MCLSLVRSLILLFRAVKCEKAFFDYCDNFYPALAEGSLGFSPTNSFTINQND